MLNLFSPHPLARNKHFQTIVSSRVTGSHPQVHTQAQETILNLALTNERVRLKGYYHPHPQSLGLVFLIHGWLGCSDSAYILTGTDFLWQQGYSVFRINMRDHADTTSLNEGAFHGGLLEEVYQAASQVATMEATKPFFVIGFSLGGNFALRIGYQHSTQALVTGQSIPNLTQIVAVNPALAPRETTLALDAGKSFYRYYFLRRWQNMLRQKQLDFPDLYDFSAELKMDRSYDVGESFIPRYTNFADSDSYYDFYTVTPERLAQLSVPTTMLTSVDDPIVPISHFLGLKNLNPYLRLDIQPYGGHIGYIDILPYQRWLPEAICQFIGDDEFNTL